MQKYYKVVNEFWSSVKASDWLSSESRYSIRYKIGEFVYPTLKNSKLFVFDNFEDAKYFACFNDGEEVFECEVINPSKARYAASLVGRVKAFWEAKSKKKSIREYAEPAIKGTIFCDAVKLVKKVA